MYRKVLIIFFFFQLLLLSGCEILNSADFTSFPDIGIPSDKVNSQILLSMPEGLGNTYKNGDSLFVEVKVISDDKIAFRKDFGVQMYMYDKQWNIVENRGKYPGSDKDFYIVEPANNDPFKTITPGFSPVIPGLKYRVPLRIVIIGNIYREGLVTDEKVGAYLDTYLKP